MSTFLWICWAFLACIAAGGMCVVVRAWRGVPIGVIDPETWPWGVALGRGYVRALPAMCLGCAALVIAGPLILETDHGSTLHTIGDGFGLLALLMAGLSFTISWFSWPRFLIEPSRRGEPGALKEWRAWFRGGDW